MNGAGTEDAGSALTAVLLQVTAQGERLAALDEREAVRWQRITSQLGEFSAQLAEARARLDGVEAAVVRQAAVLDALDGLDRHVAELASRLASDAGGYRPVPAPRWWALEGDERQAALARLRAWVGQVYRAGYGHLAASLGSCWELHPLCLYGLDWLMELWSTLYLADERDPAMLASQAEWQARLLPALAAQMHTETSRCQHAHLRPGTTP